VDFEGFTPAQREAVLADDGPLAILAGPGSGKTTVLAGRIAHLVRGRGVPPTSILALTFTTAAADALRRRLAGVLGGAAQQVDVTTFHALGNATGPRARIYAATDEVDEARFVATEIRRLLASDHLEHPGQVAVLYRTNAQARTFADALRAAGLPVRARAGADLFTRRAVRDALAYLRLVHCPADGPALARIINTPPRRLSGTPRATPVPSRGAG
jgi:superfamily I DNA/RNA helicase